MDSGLGDRAVETALSSIENALNGQPNTYRHRIDHNAYINPDDLSPYGEIGVVTVIFGYFPTCALEDSGGVHPKYGEAAIPMFVRGRSLLDANPGLHVGWHSDAPSVGIGPIPDLYSLVTRKGLRKDGVTVCQPPDWGAAEAITVEEALQIMTIGSAYAVFMEDKIGSLEPGKFADLVVLSDNPLTVDPDTLIDLEVLMTMVGGRVEYCAQQDVCPAPPASLPSPEGEGALLPATTTFTIDENVPYAEDGDPGHMMTVYTPDGEGPFPALIVIHGGGWRAGSRDSGRFRAEGVRYASRDIAAFSIDYQLSTPDLPSWPTNIQDVVCAVRHIRENAAVYNIDPERVAVLGYGAGGHLAAILATMRGDESFLAGACGDPLISSRVVLAASYWGPGDLDVFGQSGEGAGSAVEQLVGASYTEAPQRWREASPHTYISPDDPTFVIAHGTSDRTVPFETSVSFVSQLEAAGVDVTFVVVEGAGHGEDPLQLNARLVLEPLMRQLLLQEEP